MKLLTGLDFFQTDPKLLKDWLELRLREKRIVAKLASDDLFFHPKVLIVGFDGQQPDFAIVGSGNLSQGGLHNNVECGLYTHDPARISMLVDWFDAHFKRASLLTDESIAEYEPVYRRNRKRRKALEKDHAAVASRITAVGKAVIANWDDAVQTAKKYFSESRSNADRDSRRVGAQDILNALKFPTFNFDRSGFNEFYSNKALGKLDPRYKRKIWKRSNRLKVALRSLMEKPEEALSELLERHGRLHVGGVGLNTITKILAAHDPKTWPVFNSRVETALKAFGYSAPRGAGMTGRYLAYRNLMKDFSVACGADIDAFALDAFFYDRSKRADKLKHKPA